MNDEVPRITEEKDIKGRHVLLRSELNVPIIDGRIDDDFRIRKSLQTISWLRARGAKIIIISHIGKNPQDTLMPVYGYLSTVINTTFVRDFLGEEGRTAVSAMNDGDVVLFENLRQHPGEVSNDIEFAKALSQFGDIYVNDAFSVSHRAHASIVGLPALLPSFAGIQFIDELENLSRVFDPPHPFLFIAGGAKFETKIPLIEKFLPIADFVFVAGALSNLFFLKKGYEVGTSLLPTESLDLGISEGSEKLTLPSDVVVKNGAGDIEIKMAEEVLAEDNMVEIGPQSLERLKDLVSKSSFILWNGPLGHYEEGFQKTTEELAAAMAASSAECIVGGGDTLAAIDQIEKEEAFSFVSTAGGAMLDFLSDESLPGIEALR